MTSNTRTKPELKFFKEDSDEKFHEYSKLWSDNMDKMYFYHEDYKFIDIDVNKHRILSIRFPKKSLLQTNKFVQILNGSGINYTNSHIKEKGFGIEYTYGKWYPEEIWVYQ